MKLLILISFIIFVGVVISQQIPSSMFVNKNEDYVYLRLENNQVLIGNRKMVSTRWENGSIDTRIVYEFLSLPFAEPPVGEKRFQNPIKLKKNIDK